MPISPKAFADLETEKTSLIEVDFPNNPCKIIRDFESSQDITDNYATVVKRVWISHLQQYEPLRNAWKPARGDPHFKHAH